MKNLLLILFLLCGCGREKIDITLKKHPKKLLTKGSFYLSTSEASISSYNVIKKFDLYKLIPNLDGLDISQESFEHLSEAIEHASRYEPYNLAILVKSDNCLARIGYCKAVLINKNI